MKKFNNIIVFGDNHGEWSVWPNYIRDHKLDNVAVIVAGDFGIGFSPMHTDLASLNFLNKRMVHSNSVLYAVRGNHDNPEYFTGKYDLSNVKLVPDYSVLNLNDINILCVGGATSVDRKERSSYFAPREKRKDTDIIVKNNYWKDEVFVYDHDKTMALKDVDVVVTHSTPNIAPPLIKGSLNYWAEHDAHIIGDCDIERAQLFQLYDNLKNNGNNLKYWFYGHFHTYYKTDIFGTTFVGLGINDEHELTLDNYENRFE